MLRILSNHDEEIDKLLEAQENAADQVTTVLLWNLIGWESGVSFLEQWHSEVEQHLNENYFKNFLDKDNLEKKTTTNDSFSCVMSHVSRI